VTRRTKKIAAWTLGMAFAGAILGSKASYSRTWYGTLFDSRWEILTGAAIGFVLGYIFSLGLSKA
jgi:NhaP-type Na+/H+ or K+/H+ antiporter